MVAVMVSSLGCVSAPGARADSCPGVATTRDLELCLAGQVTAHEAVLERYLAESRRLVAVDPDALAALDAAQAAWQTYSDKQCSAVYAVYETGTIRGVQFAGCKLEVTERRTHELWQTYIESMVSDLPEPGQFE